MLPCCENFHPITIFESTRCELAFAMSGKEALANCKGPVKIGTCRFRANCAFVKVHLMLCLFGKLLQGTIVQSSVTVILQG